MARLFGQNDIQSLLQHLNKYSVSNIKSIGQTSVATASIVNADIDTKDKAKVSNKRSHDERVAVELSKSDRKRLKKQHKQEALQQLEQTKLAKEEGEETKTMLATPSDDNTEVIITARNERSQKLRNSSLERLMEAQFRSMNEYLYSNSSMMALSYMDKNLFEKYHQAYRKIVERWPVKPLDIIIEKVEQVKRKSKKTFTIADMGCGDAALAKYFAGKEDKDSVKVHSYDLVAGNEFVTQSSMDNVPLDADCCDVVVFCLSLMGINIKDCLLEANRILKKDGILLIAEVSSRFEDFSVQKFNQTLEAFNFRMQKQQFLQPNDFFVLFQGRKTDSVTKLKGLPYVTLKACRYKIR